MGCASVRRRGRRRGRLLASVEDCRKALDGLAAALAAVEPELRARHVPARTVACRLTDLELVFAGRLDEDGVHDITEVDDGQHEVDVRLTMDSDELVALADG